MSVAASVPSDMIDSDRPWPCPLVLLASGVAGVFRDSAGRWPRRWGWGGGFCDTNDELREAEGLVEEWTGGSLRCLSPPGANPFCLRVGERSRACPSGRATFLKVIVHSTSSPANTVAFFHCTNTRMFEADMVWRGGVVDAGCRVERRSSSDVWLVKRHDAFQMVEIAEVWLRSQLQSERVVRRGFGVT